MKKSELETIKSLVQNHYNDLIESLEICIDSDTYQEDAMEVVADKFSELYDAARRFKRASGIEMKFLDDIDRTSIDLSNCEKKRQDLDLELSLLKEECKKDI